MNIQARRESRYGTYDCDERKKIKKEEKWKILKNVNDFGSGKHPSTRTLKVEKRLLIGENGRM